MKQKTILEKFKEQEVALNVVAEALGFAFKMSICSEKEATLTLYKKGKKITNFEILNIRTRAETQIIIKSKNLVITDTLYYRFFMTFLSNYLYYENVEFVYQFHGGKYDSLIMTETELEKILGISMKDFRKNMHFSLKDELEKQPEINNYQKAFCVGSDFNMLFFVYNATSE